MSQTYVQPSRVGQKSLTTWHDADFVKRVKLMAVREDMTIQEFVECALDMAMDDEPKRKPAKKQR